MQNQLIMITITCPDMEQAQSIGRALIEQKLTTTTHTNTVNSSYRWQEQIHEAQEVELKIKTTTSLYPAIEQLVLQLHSYQCPEIIALPIVCCNKAWEDWLVAGIKQD